MQASRSVHLSVLVQYCIVIKDCIITADSRIQLTTG